MQRCEDLLTRAAEVNKLGGIGGKKKNAKKNKNTKQYQREKF
jgi:hypothetical protein